MNNMKNIAALIGLIGAVNNNEKTENTDDIVRKALISEDSDEIVNQIHEEKYAISPNCRTCAAPCGNTSDYDIDSFWKAPVEIVEAKQRLIKELAAMLGRTNGELSEVVYRAVSYLGYDLSKETYDKIISEIRECQ